MTKTPAADMSPRPGWPEIAVGLLAYAVLLAIVLVVVTLIPPREAGLRGIVGTAANGVAGLGGLLAAYALRIRTFRAFGFRPVAVKWLAAAVGLGMLAFGASFVIEHVYFAFINEANTQADFQAAAKDGLLSLAVLMITGAVFTPIGEEVVFRGVLMTALGQYGAYAAVVGSALVFALFHGFSVIYLLALMMGLITGVLYRRSGSIWAAIAAHVTYNGLHLFGYAVL